MALFWQRGGALFFYLCHSVCERSLGVARKANWEKIKTEYITGDISQRKLAAKYGVSRSTLQKIAADEKWTALRDKHRKETVQKACQKTAEKQAENIKDILLTAAMMATTIDDAMKDPEQFRRYIVTEGLGEGFTETSEKIFDRVDFRALKDAAAALQTVAKIQKEILAMDRIVDQEKRERLDIDRSKANVVDDEQTETGVVVLAPVLEADKEEEDDE